MTELSGPTEARSPRPGGDSPPKAKGAPGSAPPGAEKKKPALGPPTDPRVWQMWLWYAALTLLILWTWQEALRAVAIHTIPYSEFKEYLAAGHVKECDIGQDDILGRIDKSASAKPATESPTPVAAASTEKGVPNDAAPDASASKKEPPPAKPDENQKPAEPKHEEEDAAKPKTESKSETKDLTEFTFRTIRVEDPKLVQELEAKGVRFEGIRPSFLSNLLWSWVIPIGVLVLLWGFLARRLGTASQSVFGFGKSRARVVADQETGVTFADVAGCDEAKQELSEIVDFLMSPSRYEALGARIPKGVLLVGPPGTGKTLLGRAVAGEAKVPFFQLSGSDFVEMFVGVGAARVRDLFQQAKAQAPCIIFLDELDAIGRQRGVHVGAVNDEREQTLNQLLVEMDGFAPNTGVILLAATNRPEVLDRALLRPGRFDRQVVVDAPDMEGRAAILKVHSRDKRFAEGVDLRRLAQATVGFSGADLSNLLNEAALLAVRRDRDRITQADLEEAMEKVVAGPERRSRRLNETEKRRVAYHEIGHALVAAYCPNSDPLHKITIVPRGRGALGYTMHLPAEDQFLMTRSELEDRIKGLLGGRAAEDVVFGEVSTGAENDLERATDLARQMVSMYGMGDKVGLAHVGRRLGQFLTPEGANQLDCSPETAREVDDEVRRLLDACYAAARQILTDHRADLDAAANHLLAVESIDAETFYSLIHKDAPSPTRPPVAVNPATNNVAGDGMGDSDAVPRSV